MTTQQYVSSELTHFVGSKRPPAGQYERLKEVLVNRHLTKYPHLSHNYATMASTDQGKMSDDTMFSPKVICFCDIPVADLEIHMSKYSRFGLSFSKEYLIRLGASPVFYVANEAAYAGPGFGGKIVTKAEVFDKLGADSFSLWHRIREHFDALPETPENEKLRSDLSTYEFILSTQVFAFVKSFNVGGMADDDPDNYYMEREWRIPNNFDFDPSEVVRVVVPESFAGRFRTDLPEYADRLHIVRVSD